MKDTTNKIIYISSAVIFLGLVAGAFYIGINKNENATENDALMSRSLAYADTTTDVVGDITPSATAEVLEEPPIDELPIDESLEDKITATTKIVYEYFYEDNGEIVKYEEAPKTFHIGETEALFKKRYNDWDISSFSSDEVVLRKVIEAPKSRSYTLGVYDGNVAVFYADVEDGANALKEVIGTPITSLSQAEQEKLLNGIPISDEDALIKILQDYSS